MQERSNNQENEPHAPTQEQTPEKRAAYNINERFIITSYFHAVLGVVLNLSAINDAQFLGRFLNKPFKNRVSELLTQAMTRNFQGDFND